MIELDTAERLISTLR